MAGLSPDQQFVLTALAIFMLALVPWVIGNALTNRGVRS